MTCYRLSNDRETLTFKSEQEASAYFGGVRGTISKAWKERGWYKGYKIERVSDTFHGETGTRLYRIWRHMRERCELESHMRYDKYGGRGISVCDEWQDYSTFAKWAREHRYRDDLSIDRIDNNGGYSPENCRWSTIKEQNNNKSNCRYITLDGETHTIAEWSDITGIRHSTICQRLAMGWDPKDILTRPLRPHVIHK